MICRLRTPRDFSWSRTVRSHGWYDLAPFSVGDDRSWIATYVRMPQGGARRMVLHGEHPVVLESPGVVGAAERRHLIAAGRRVLALDVDVSEFHAVVKRDPRHRWIATARAGRLLRAPTAFEDLVKLVLTTNCSWAFTRKMTSALVARYGELAGDGGRSFPTPERLARVPEEEFRESIRAGYRSPYLAGLSGAVARGEADPESWDHDPRDASILRKEIEALPGVGPYVSENLLKFLGKPDGLALDSAIRAKYFELYHAGRAVKDRSIARRMAPLGRWAGLALWFDLWRDWMWNAE